MSTSWEVTRALWVFSSWIALDFESASDIGEEVGGKRETLAERRAFKYFNTFYMEGKEVDAYLWVP